MAQASLNKNTPQRSVAGLLLYTNEKKILLQHRDVNAKRLPDYWGTFGGGIEPGETPEEALRREILEELEYKVKNPLLLIERPYTSWLGEVGISYTFVEAFDPTQKMVQHEGQGMGWFSIPEAKKLKLTPDRYADLQKIGEYLDKLY